MQQGTDLRDMITVLAHLTEEREPQWGTMTPQRMVEHLADTFRASRGIPKLPILLDERRIAVSRRFLFSDQPLPRNVDNPVMAPPRPLIHSSLSEAIAVLGSEVDEFYRFYSGSRTETFAHPYFGMLTFDEWIVFHRKHVRHHCEQFDLFKSAGVE